MRAIQLVGDQCALEGLDLLAQIATSDYPGSRFAGRLVEPQAKAQGEALGGVLQLAHVARPRVT